MQRLIKGRLFFKWLSMFAFAYLYLIIFGLFFSEQIIFLPPATAYQASDKLISIKSSTSSEPGNEHLIVARHVINPAAQYTIIYSHGNAVDIGGLTHLQRNFVKQGYSIVIYDYSGYGLSEGEPSEQQVYNDVHAVYNYLTETLEISPAQIISYGHSLGAAVATNLAASQTVAALILESPFVTAFRVKTVYPLVPFDKFSNLDKIANINTPLFITHSRDDPVISFWHSEMLFARARQPKTNLWLENTGHAGASHEDLFWLSLDKFIQTKVAR